MAAAAQREWAGKELDLGINYWLHLWRRRGRKEEYLSDHSSSLEKNAFWELKLDVIFLSPTRECGIWDLPLESGDSARIFILNLAVAKLFEIHLPHFFQWISSNFVCVKTETVVQIYFLCDTVTVIQDIINEISLSHWCFCRYQDMFV